MGGVWTVLSPLCPCLLLGQLTELPALPGASGEAPEHPALLPTQLRGRPVQARPVRCSPFAEGAASSCSSVPALFCELWLHAATRRYDFLLGCWWAPGTSAFCWWWTVRALCSPDVQHYQSIKTVLVVLSFDSNLLLGTVGICINPN